MLMTALWAIKVAQARLIEKKKMFGAQAWVVQIDMAHDREALYVPECVLKCVLSR
jgi:hypothetical protein